MEEFTIYFNKRRQWITVHLWDVHPTTFAKWKGGYWGYYESKYENPRDGKLGEIHLVKSRIREDLVVHEFFHALCDWSNARGLPMNPRHEERLACILDEMVGKFYRGLKALDKNKKE